jgi:hypothetical protein
MVLKKQQVLQLQLLSKHWERRNNSIFATTEIATLNI